MNNTADKTKNEELKKKLQEISDNADTELKAHVADHWRDRVDDYDNGADWISDLMQGGCIAGTVGELIYTGDCQAFYDKHYDAIEELIEELEESMGEPVQPHGDHKGIDHKTFRAWLGFEETARQIAQELEIEV